MVFFQQFNSRGGGAASGGHKRHVRGVLFHHGFASSMLGLFFSDGNGLFAIRALDRLGMAHAALQQTGIRFQAGSNSA